MPIFDEGSKVWLGVAVTGQENDALRARDALDKKQALQEERQATPGIAEQLLSNAIHDTHAVCLRAGECALKGSVESTAFRTDIEMACTNTACPGPAMLFEAKDLLEDDVEDLTVLHAALVCATQRFTEF